MRDIFVYNSFTVEDFESYRSLAFDMEKDINKKDVYTDDTTWANLSKGKQKFAFLVIVRSKQEKELPTELGNRIFVSELMHETAKTNILKYLRFVQQVPGKTILGKEPF